jgi:O-methyltransferase involved in polyketide biosynthesis
VAAVRDDETEATVVQQVPQAIDVNTPNVARIYDYMLGGKDNFAADRAAAEQILSAYPESREGVQHNRAFLGKAVEYLVEKAAIRQFVDIGTGLPTQQNVHQVAQSLAPDARIVYVDNDPLVLAHARALLVSTPEGSTKYLHADMHDADGLIEAAAEAADFTEPVAILFMGVLGHMSDLDEARALVRTLLARVPSGSYLAIADGTPVEAMQKAHEQYAKTGAVPYLTRQPEEIASFFDGLEWVEPGFVSITLWRPDRPPGGVTVINPSPPMPISTYGGVARKP